MHDVSAPAPRARDAAGAATTAAPMDFTPMNALLAVFRWLDALLAR